MQRFTPIAGSFVIVLVTYLAYALLAVRLIEPTIDLTDQRRSHSIDPKGLVEEQIKAIKRQFLPGRLEALGLTTPKMLQLGGSTLLFQRYDNLPDARLSITPCVVVVGYEGPADSEEQRLRQSIILEAPEGALLKFDEALDISRAKVGRLKTGQLLGPVRILSDCKEPGPNDDLLIQARDVRLTDDTVSTPYPVEFRWGPHFGRGQQMVMKLLTGAPQATGPSITGIASFELREVERLHLDLGQAMSSSAPTASGSKPTSVPVEVHCRGPFQFDVVHRVATFRDGVEIMKLNPAGPADQIACDLLALHFADRQAGKPSPAQGGKPAGGANSLDLVAQRFEAKGNPVVVIAPSQTLQAHGPRLEYDLAEQSVTLDGGDVMLQQGPNEIHGASLRYRAGERGRLGRVDAQGPGWLHGRMADRPDQQLEAVWKGELRVFPHEQNQVVSLGGGAELKLPGMGQLQAREVFFWLTETPARVAGGQPTLHPDRMLARNAVRMNSPQLSGELEQLEVWFGEGTVAGDQGQVAGQVTNSPSGVQGSGFGVQDTALNGSPQRDGSGKSAASGPWPVAPAAAIGLSMQPNGPIMPQSVVLQRFRIAGRLLRTRVLLGGPQPGVSSLLVEDGVQFWEEQTARPGEQPLVVRGDRLEVADATGRASTVVVSGRPARFDGRGLALSGSTIKLDRGNNSLSIDGAGQMELIPISGLNGQPDGAPSKLTIDWQRSMEFDGQTATFQGPVIVTGPEQRLETKTMKVRLQRPIRFSEPGFQGLPEVETIHCLDGVSIKNRRYDRQHHLAGYDQIQVSDLIVNKLNGELNAGGPGRFNSVVHGAGGGATIPGMPASSQPASGGDQLYCLNIRFQGSIKGNIVHQQMAFNDRVQTAYAPVGNDWDAMLTDHNPDRLGPEGVTLRCERLSVIEMPSPTENQRSLELEASENAVVENTICTAKAHRITYAEAKGLLILEGDGRNDSHLYRQMQKGGDLSEIVARKILYWPKTNAFNVDGLRSVQSSQMRK